MEIVRIIEGIKREEEWACRQLIDSYGDRILRVAYGILKDKQLAEDTVQEVFLKVFRKIDQHNSDRSFDSWLYTITVNQCRNKMRKWTFKKLFFVDQFLGFNERSDEKVEETILQDEKAQILHKEIRRLKAKYREVIILYYYEDLSVKEIGEVLDVKENTIKTRLRRGRNYLKKNLEDNEEVQYVLLQTR
mgnify:FL=1